ncbi:polyprenyl synthetase family protein [Sphingobacterium sp. SGL-16]|uniref:Polyprenyl synthetase family protein n=2 Tax=Sphingobacteriaceae TaxID=84566 RepID=A0ABR7YD92_9SPHI|nr:polyprenyl synthetase family protein [Sphingobacterium litopenaei]NGM72646.1 polyprenyl synthetase family protein [Sphingobacterium sp. SGL-16]
MFGNPYYAEKISDALENIQLPESPNNLYEPIHYILSLSGKRIRPQLVFMGASLFGYKDWGKVLPASIAIEYFHNFSLMHDDIMDKAPLRRGKQTVHQKWNENVAILSGDALLVKSYEELSKCPAFAVSELLKTFNRVALEVCEGQQHDMDFELRNDVSESEYINMIRLKTSVLLGGALELGAIIAGANAENRQKLYDFGVNLGIAFQLQDDILDTFGNPETFGKQVGGDIIVNKKTILHILLKKSLSIEDQIEFDKILALSEENAEEKVSRMKILYQKYKIFDLANTLKNGYSSKSLDSLNAIDILEENKQDLVILSNNLLNRNK